MTVSAWGSWLITTFTSRHSAGTMTAQSTWVSCNQYMGVLDSLYSADSKYIVTRNKSGNREMYRCREKQTSILIHTFRQKLWYFSERLKFNSEKNKNKTWARTDKLTATCLHPCTWQWRSAVVWGRGHGQALVGVRGQQTGWCQSLGGTGWRSRGAARRSQRWRWWRGAGRSCRLGDPRISLVGWEGRERWVVSALLLKSQPTLCHQCSKTRDGATCLQVCCGGSWISVYFCEHSEIFCLFLSLSLCVCACQGSGVQAFWAHVEHCRNLCVITHPLISGSLQHINRTSKILATTRHPPTLLPTQVVLLIYKNRQKSCLPSIWKSEKCKQHTVL